MSKKRKKMKWGRVLSGMIIMLLVVLSAPYTYGASSLSLGNNSSGGNFEDQTPSEMKAAAGKKEAGIKAEVIYDVWANGERFTSDHLTIACGEGTAVFDPATYTLTLNNATISRGCEIPNTLAVTYCQSGIFSLKSINITLIGDNRIEDTGGTGIDTYGMEPATYANIVSDVHISGPGKLKIEETAPYDGYGIYITGALTIDNADIEIKSMASGIWADSALSVVDSIIKIDKLGDRYFGIVVGSGDAAIGGSVIVGNLQPIDGSGGAERPFFLFDMGHGYTLTDGSAIITYNKDISPVVEGSKTGILSNPENSAVWAIRGGVDGIDYHTKDKTGFVGIPLVDVTPDPTIIPATDIINLPERIPVGTSVQLEGKVLPDNATKKTVIWEIIDAGTTDAELTTNTSTEYVYINGILTKVVHKDTFLQGKHAGIVKIRGTIDGGAGGGRDYTKDFFIAITPAENPIIHTVHFDGNGGWVSPETLYTDPDGKLHALPVPNKAGGYIFEGWFTMKEGGTKVTEEYIFDGDLTLYAHWTLKDKPEPEQSSSEPTTPTLPGGEKGGSGKVVKTAKTGDDSPIGVFVVLMIAGAVTWTENLRRKNRI